ncbi:uncharacterized protein BT62DRAFT_1072872 [Guyanagaster necrorhizus]|uniref:Uncharacterized protein n=1 Tax=Guyanagaster necrorhizus TaxID=856835 RepID=A0A9P7W2K3_9AGAR|nr:uncharacterized protein BT62DRAFT_1072872 [Guyanagaster necrorhizus MCA 3950]KAG7450854.1 hypothetical protein BT62DRAFT_1072872 [Guyanagaster necrorhizus MCA 3950]
MPLNALTAPPESEYIQPFSDSLATLPHTTLLVMLSLTQHAGDAIVQINSQSLALGDIFSQHKQTYLHIVSGSIGPNDINNGNTSGGKTCSLMHGSVPDHRARGRALLVNAPSLGDGTLTEISPFGTIFSDTQMNVSAVYTNPNTHTVKAGYSSDENWRYCHNLEMTRILGSAV